MKTIDKKEFGARVRRRREELGKTQDEIAAAIGMKQQGIVSIEHGAVERPRRLRELALELHTTEEHLLYGESRNAAPAATTRPILDALVPVYGQAVGGADGEFPLNGQEFTTITAPGSLRGVPGAYAIYVVGESMEPRYFAGEAVFVNPRLPVRRGDFVVAQIAAEDEGSPPLAYVKRFLSKDSRAVRLDQFNPKKTLEFPARKLVSLHRIVMGGDG